MNGKTINLIYELKGIIGTLSDLSIYSEEFDHPAIERIESKTNEIIESIEVE